MKKLLAVLALVLMVFMFSPQVIMAADGDETPPPDTEVITEDEPATEPVDVEPIDYDQQVADFTADLNIVLTQVFAWIGGFAGLSALVAYALRYIKDKGLMKALREDIATMRADSTEGKTLMNNMTSVVKQHIDKNAVLEKSVIHLITLSDLDSKLKEQVISGLKNDTIEVAEVLAAGLVQVQTEIEKKVDLQAKIDAASESLLEKLAKQTTTEV